MQNVSGRPTKCVACNGLPIQSLLGSVVGSLIAVLINPEVSLSGTIAEMISALCLSISSMRMSSQPGSGCTSACSMAKCVTAPSCAPASAAVYPWLNTCPSSDPPPSGVQTLHFPRLASCNRLRAAREVDLMAVMWHVAEHGRLARINCADLHVRLDVLLFGRLDIDRCCNHVYLDSGFVLGVFRNCGAKLVITGITGM